MEILVSQVRKGDYVDGFGVVTDVRKFYRERAVKSKTGNALNRRERFDAEDKLVYARIVAQQAEQSYDNLLDNVVLVSDGKFRTFSADKTIKVYRVFKEAV